MRMLLFVLRSNHHIHERMTWRPCCSSGSFRVHHRDRQWFQWPYLNLKGWHNVRHAIIYFFCQWLLLTLIIDAGTSLLCRKYATVNREDLVHLQRLLAMDNLVGVIWRHTGKSALTLSTILEEIDIVIIALEQENKRVCGKRSKVLV